MKELRATEVQTGLVRFSYANVFVPKAIQDSEPKYSVSLIIPKSDKRTIAAIKNAIQEAYNEGENKLKGNAKTAPSLAKVNTTFYDGDEERPDDEVYAGAYYLNTTSKTKPIVTDAEKRPITDPEDFYSGCYGRARINFYAYNAGVNKGIAAGLQAVQKIRPGERLGGNRVTAEDAFDDWQDDEDFLG